MTESTQLQRRNRALVIIMVVVALISAAAGTLYLRHYGFHSTQTETVRFH